MNFEPEKREDRKYGRCDIPSQSGKLLREVAHNANRGFRPEEIRKLKKMGLFDLEKTP